MLVKPGIVNKQISPQDCPFSKMKSEWPVTAFGNYDQIKDGVKVSWAPHKKHQIFVGPGWYKNESS